MDSYLILPGWVGGTELRTLLAQGFAPSVRVLRLRCAHRSGWHQVV